MKLEVRSLPIAWSRKRDRLRFFGKKTILNVHETGFTIEGLVPEVWFPVFMRFIYRAVSDWSIRSIPFSRIRKCRVRNRRTIRWAICVLWSAVLATVLFYSSWKPSYVLFPILALNFGVSFWLTRLGFKDYVDLVYETKQSRRCALRLRFLKAGDKMLLFQEIGRHRLEVTAPALAIVAKNVTQRRTISFRRNNRGGKS